MLRNKPLGPILQNLAKKQLPKRFLLQKQNPGFNSIKKLLNEKPCYHFSSSQNPEANFQKSTTSIYKVLNEQDLTKFRTIIGDKNVKTDQDERTIYSTCWNSQYIGNSSVVLTPETTQQVSQILSYCNEQKLLIVPQGGNTSLVGGSVPIDTEIVLSLKKMNQVLSFDDKLGQLECESGCILENLENQVSSHGYEIPYDLGARGTCTIGGNVATHAGGIHFVKHGPLRGNVLGLEVVLANGKILDMMLKVRKDSTGPDLKHLFIQSEGTLGIITKVGLLCHKSDNFSKLVFLDVDSYQQVLQVHDLAKRFLGRSLSAIEYMDYECYYTVYAERSSDLDFPIPIDKLNKDKYFVQIEASGESEEKIMNLFENLAENLEAENILNEMVLAESLTQARNIWEIRENVGECMKARSLYIIYDVSLPIQNFQEIVDLSQEWGEELCSFSCGFGHIGDGNLHQLVNCAEGVTKEQLTEKVEPKIMKYVGDIKGSISSEHGVGAHKTKYLHLQKGEEVLGVMREVKMLFDPNLILNPRKVFE